jgi:predicted metal-dependent phosphoesterase TrpH
MHTFCNVGRDVIDLHTHSSASDGSDPPARIAELAAAAGCSAVALTDHDRLDGLPEAGARAGELGIQLVPGCEISCQNDATLHLLVYFVEDGDRPLPDALRRLQRARDDRNRRLADHLSGLGLPVTYDEILEEAGGKGAGRPHVAAILVRKGIVGSVQEAFDVWLGKGRPGYLDKERLTVGDAIRLARESGAVTSLAHPFTLGLEPAALGSAIGELAALGLTAIEAIYGRYTPAERDGLAAVAGRYGLVVTGGSDHHGTYKPDIRVGTGTGDLNVPDHALDDLRARLPG